MTVRVLYSSFQGACLEEKTLIPEAQRDELRAIGKAREKATASRLRRLAASLLALALLGAGPAAGAQDGSPASGGAAAQSTAGANWSTISGTVTARDGTPLEGVRVRLVVPGLLNEPVSITSSTGVFMFGLVPDGPFELIASIDGFAPRRVQGQLRKGIPLSLPPIVLSLATATAEVRVIGTQREIAQAQVNMELKQRALGVIPNFLVSYDWKPAPLNAKQKFRLSWRSVIDPFSFVITGIAAGVQQADDDRRGYGQGAAGYGKRYGADYGNLVIGTLLGSAVLPIVFRQDNRFLFKSTGSVTNRALYAISATVICRSDKGDWEPNYSNILGSLGAGAITNLYSPQTDRNDAAAVVEDGLIGVATGAIGNLFQEFLVRRFTPHAPPIIH